jgi:hypothetical protein
MSSKKPGRDCDSTADKTYRFSPKIISVTSISGDDSRAPSMCLVCGEVVCSQSYCCQAELDGEAVGACTAHAHTCGARVGIFLRYGTLPVQHRDSWCYVQGCGSGSAFSWLSWIHTRNAYPDPRALQKYLAFCFSKRPLCLRRYSMFFTYYLNYLILSIFFI